MTQIAGLGFTTGYRTSLIRERAREVNRLQKVLEGANITLASVASSIVGASGRAILEALVGGEEAPEVLADLAKGRLRAKREALMRALAGRFRPHQRFLLAQQLAHIDYLDEAIGTVSAEIAKRLGPFEDALTRLDSIPGIGRQTAEVLLAEIGLDLAWFPAADHLASWAGLCPGNNESAGKRHSGRTRKGSPWLRSALAEAAQAAPRAKKTYLAAQYHRLVARRGRKKAPVAVAHRMLVIAYHLLARGECYKDLEPTCSDQREQHAVERRLTRRLERLGYRVVLEPVA